MPSALSACTIPPQPRWWRATLSGSTVCRRLFAAIARERHTVCRLHYADAFPSRAGRGQHRSAAPCAATSASRSRETSALHAVPLWRRAALRAMCCRRHIAIARDEHAAFPPRSAAALPSHAGGGPRYVPPPARRVTSPGSSSPVEAGPCRRRFGLRRRHGPRARRQRVLEAFSPNELDTVGDGAVSLSLVNWHLSGRLGVTAEAPAHGAGGSDPGP